MNETHTQIPMTTGSSCPIAETLKLIGDIWTLLIIRSLLEDSRRFCEIEKAIPEINTRTLTERLKRLVENGLIKREQFAQIPPKVKYTITEKGRGLEGIIKEIEKYAYSTHGFQITPHEEFLKIPS